jgi:hypothetical protein
MFQEEGKMSKTVEGKVIKSYQRNDLTMIRF